MMIQVLLVLLSALTAIPSQTVTTKGKDTADHLFFRGTLARDLWNYFFNTLGNYMERTTITRKHIGWMGKNANKNILPLVIVRSIWIERNNRTLKKWARGMVLLRSVYALVELVEDKTRL